MAKSRLPLRMFLSTTLFEREVATPMPNTYGNGRDAIRLGLSSREPDLEEHREGMTSIFATTWPLSAARLMPWSLPCTFGDEALGRSSRTTPLWKPVRCLSRSSPRTVGRPALLRRGRVGTRARDRMAVEVQRHAVGTDDQRIRGRSAGEVLGEDRVNCQYVAAGKACSARWGQWTSPVASPRAAEMKQRVLRR